MPDNLLNVLPWNTCNAACQHCFWASNPTDKTALPERRMLRLIQEAANEFKGRWNLSLSGGEVFLFYERLLGYCRTAQALGGSVLVITNCYWARDEQVAREKLVPLVDAGLTALGVSADEFHEPYIPLERVATAVIAARKLGLRTHLHVAATQKHRLWMVLRSLADEALWFSEFMESPCLPVGKAAHEVPSQEFIYQDEFPRGTCPAASLTINAKGEGMICCNGVGEFTEMNVGNVMDCTFSELRQNFHRSPVLQFLLDEGPAAALEFLSPEEQAEFRNRKYVSVCHLCYDVFRDPNRRRKLLERIATAPPDHDATEESISHGEATDGSPL